MRTIFLLLLFPAQSIFGQTDYMPFELERFPPAHYQSIIHDRDTVFTSEIEALTYYFLAYKIQRSENPAAYFPMPDQKRKMASAYLNSEYPTGAGIALVHFLESSGDQASCTEILKATSDYKLLLPYRFIAEVLTQNKGEARKTLIKMDTEGMLSLILKAYGKNAVASFEDKKIVITQGIQDLIAITYALRPDSKIEIQNLFLEKCSAFDGRSVKSIIKNDAQKLWIAPTVDINNIGSSENLYDQGIYLQGIGSTFSFKTEKVKNRDSSLGLNFAGIRETPTTPADKGLIHSYQYFSSFFTWSADKFGSIEEKKAAEAISLFVKQTDK